jgi:hypothetical protein
MAEDGRKRSLWRKKTFFLIGPLAEKTYDGPCRRGGAEATGQRLLVADGLKVKDQDYDYDNDYDYDYDNDYDYD